LVTRMVSRMSANVADGGDVLIERLFRLILIPSCESIAFGVY
jgi:hypothetical protein